MEQLKREPAGRDIWICGGADTAAPVFTDSVVAVATDDETLEIPEGVARLDVNNPAAVANFVISLKANRDHL